MNVIRFFFIAIILLIFFLIIFGFGFYFGEDLNKEEIIFTKDQINIFNQKNQLSFPNEFVTCLNLNENEMIDYYDPEIYDKNVDSVTFSTCFSGGDIHSHPNNNPYLSEEDRQNLQLGNYRCIIYGYNKVKCYVFKEVEIKLKDE